MASNNKKKYSWVPDFVYGGIDGVVTTFAVVAGVKGANLDVAVILILGFANLLGDGFSMAVGKYSSDKASIQDLKSSNASESHLESINPVKGGLYTFISFNTVGIIPLLGYIFGPIFGLNDQNTFIVTSVFTLIALFLIGYVKGKYVSVSKLYAGIETMFIGGIAATIAYFVGFYVETLI